MSGFLKSLGELDSTVAMYTELHSDELTRPLAGHSQRTIPECLWDPRTHDNWQM